MAAIGIAAAGEAQPLEGVEPHMGTLVRIQLYAEGNRDARAALTEAFARIGALDQALSDYKEDSELNRLCRATAGVPVAISADLLRVLTRAQRLARETDGAFDVTIGRLTRLWRRKQLPDAAALAATGYQKLALDAEHRTAILAVDGMQLDLGAIAKGYAADEALLVLRQAGFPSALVVLSGDIAAGEPPPGKPAWRVAIPMAPRFVTLRHQAVSTSGDAVQYFNDGAKRYSHIINPRTGLGLTGRISVSVVARDGITADSLATALTLVGPERAPGLLALYPGAQAYFSTPAAP
jgi:FAD:protein FMN transferase